METEGKTTIRVSKTVAHKLKSMGMTYDKAIQQLMEGVTGETKDILMAMTTELKAQNADMKELHSAINKLWDNRDLIVQLINQNKKQ